MNILIVGIMMSSTQIVTPASGECHPAVEVSPSLVEAMMSTQTAFVRPAKLDGQFLKRRAENALTPETPPDYIRVVANQPVDGNVQRTLYVSCDKKHYLIYDREGLAHDEVWYGPMVTPGR
jgi:hypothetical protein